MVSLMSDAQHPQRELPQGYKDWREYRRQLAWSLVERGMSQKSVAEILDVTQAAVSQWVKKAREGGSSALAKKPYPERAKKLAQEHIERLLHMLEQGAQAHGFGERWTLTHIASFIEEMFGVQYHPAHVSRLLRQWGFELQDDTTQLLLT